MRIVSIIMNSRLYDSTLYRGFLFILLSMAISAFTGFIFWMLAAKYYSMESVGIASALISSMMLLSILSRFGFHISIIQFFPNGDKSAILSTYTNITVIVSSLLAIVYICGINLWAPKLSILHSNFSFIFVIILVINSITPLFGYSFIAIKKPETNFLIYLITGLRIVALYPFISYGEIGIFSAVGFSLIITLLFSIYCIKKNNLKLYVVIDEQYIKGSLKSSFANYLTNILILIPNQIIPIMVFNILGAREAAIFIIPFTISSTSLMISNSVSTSLLVEGSHGRRLKPLIFNSVAISYALTIPVISIVLLFGQPLLSIIGTLYVEGYALLKILILSSLVTPFFYIYLSVLRIAGETTRLIVFPGFVFFLQILFSYLLLSKFGIVGVGYAWFLSYCLGLLVIIFYHFKSDGSVANVM